MRGVEWVMKKYAVGVLSVLILLCFTGCSSGISSVALQSSKREFILTPKICKSFLSCDPNEAYSSLIESPWVNGHFISATEDKDGNLRLVLSDNDIIHWKNYIKKILYNIKKVQVIVDVLLILMKNIQVLSQK